MNLALTQSYLPVRSPGLDGPTFIARGRLSFLNHTSSQGLISFLCGVQHAAIYTWQSSRAVMRNSWAFLLVLG